MQTEKLETLRPKVGTTLLEGREAEANQWLVALTWRGWRYLVQQRREREMWSRQMKRLRTATQQDVQTAIRSRPRPSIDPR